MTPGCCHNEIQMRPRRCRMCFTCSPTYHFLIHYFHSFSSRCTHTPIEWFWDPPQKKKKLKCLFCFLSFFFFFFFAFSSSSPSFLSTQEYKNWVHFPQFLWKKTPNLKKMCAFLTNVTYWVHFKQWRFEFFFFFFDIKLVTWYVWMYLLCNLCFWHNFVYAILLHCFFFVCLFVCVFVCFFPLCVCVWGV